MTVRYASVGKEFPLFTENEDAWRVDTEGGIWAVADGAGGTGIYAGEWARFLVGQVPAQPFSVVEEVADWLNTHWGRFFDQYQARAAANYLTELKFMNEGSGATLATLHQRETWLHWSVYGDALVLCFNPATGQLRASNPALSQFAEAPYLLNWLLPCPAEGFRSGRWPHESGLQFALCTDTLGQYLLMAYQALAGDGHELVTLGRLPTALGNRAQAHQTFWQPVAGSFLDQVWEPLWQAMASPDAFLQHTQSLRASQLLGVDDYTCILIAS
ncbi:hypothetical protein [Spirosoma fluviale]|uniref:Serine/threonine protein phosphatase PrpC n=1 Tax=Spirosoma fluviale TaxID=1597977 RepID=A0A286G3F6_9BACT|nr:hypothetical protein [Spirosoma fluviale]SOD90012.1 hypothetical protein SAMN06269250_3267 [Spirosoma fluviale]